MNPPTKGLTVLSISILFLFYFSNTTVGFLHETCSNEGTPPNNCYHTEQLKNIWKPNAAIPPNVDDRRERINDLGQFRRVDGRRERVEQRIRSSTADPLSIPERSRKLIPADDRRQERLTTRDAQGSRTFLTDRRVVTVNRLSISRDRQISKDRTSAQEERQVRQNTFDRSSVTREERSADPQRRISRSYRQQDDRRISRDRTTFHQNPERQVQQNSYNRVSERVQSDRRFSNDKSSLRQETERQTRQNPFNRILERSSDSQKRISETIKQQNDHGISNDREQGRQVRQTFFDRISEQSSDPKLAKYGKQEGGRRISNYRINSIFESERQIRQNSLDRRERSFESQRRISRNTGHQTNHRISIDKTTSHQEIDRQRGQNSIVRTSERSPDFQRRISGTGKQDERRISNNREREKQIRQNSFDQISGQPSDSRLTKEQKQEGRRISNHRINYILEVERQERRNSLDRRDRSFQTQISRDIRQQNDRRISIARATSHQETDKQILQNPTNRVSERSFDFQRRISENDRQQKDRRISTDRNMSRQQLDREVRQNSIDRTSERSSDSQKRISGIIKQKGEDRISNDRKQERQIRQNSFDRILERRLDSRLTKGEKQENHRIPNHGINNIREVDRQVRQNFLDRRERSSEFQKLLSRDNRQQNDKRISITTTTLQEPERQVRQNPTNRVSKRSPDSQRRISEIVRQQNKRRTSISRNTSRQEPKSQVRQNSINRISESSLNLKQDDRKIRILDRTSDFRSAEREENHKVSNYRLNSFQEANTKDHQNSFDRTSADRRERSADSQIRISRSSRQADRLKISSDRTISPQETERQIRQNSLNLSGSPRRIFRATKQKDDRKTSVQKVKREVRQYIPERTSDFRSVREEESSRISNRIKEAERQIRQTSFDQTSENRRERSPESQRRISRSAAGRRISNRVTTRKETEREIRNTNPQKGVTSIGRQQNDRRFNDIVSRAQRQIRQYSLNRISERLSEFRSTRREEDARISSYRRNSLEESNRREDYELENRREKFNSKRMSRQENDRVISNEERGLRQERKMQLHQLSYDRTSESSPDSKRRISKITTVQEEERRTSERSFDTRSVKQEDQRISNYRTNFPKDTEQQVRRRTLARSSEDRRERSLQREFSRSVRRADNRRISSDRTSLLRESERQIHQSFNRISGKLPKFQKTASRFITEDQRIVAGGRNLILESKNLARQNSFNRINVRRTEKLPDLQRRVSRSVKHDRRISNDGNISILGTERQVRATDFQRQISRSSRYEHVFSDRRTHQISKPQERKAQESTKGLESRNSFKLSTSRRSYRERNTGLQNSRITPTESNIIRRVTHQKDNILSKERRTSPDNGLNHRTNQIAPNFEDVKEMRNTVGQTLERNRRNDYKLQQRSQYFRIPQTITERKHSQGNIDQNERDIVLERIKPSERRQYGSYHRRNVDENNNNLSGNRFKRALFPNDDGHGKVWTNFLTTTLGAIFIIHSIMQSNPQKRGYFKIPFLSSLTAVRIH